MWTMGRPATGQHEEMMAKIDSGHKLESLSEITEEYRQVLVRQLAGQAVGELGGAYILIPWIKNAPTMDSKARIANIVKEETEHAQLIFALLEELGVATEPIYSMNEHFSMRLFNLKINTWTEVVVYNFLLDAAADHFLGDYADSSWGPWSRAMKQISEEEVGHIEHGQRWIENLSKDETTKTAVQRAIDFWHPKIAAIFGRPGNELNRLACQYRIQLRNNIEMRAVWQEQMKSLLSALGYTIPDIVDPAPRRFSSLMKRIRVKVLYILIRFQKRFC